MWPDQAQQQFAKRQLDDHGYILIPSSGISMFPLIRSGDLCTFVPLSPARAKSGAIVLFADKDGKLIGHRLLRSEKKDGKVVYICKGDTNLLADEPVGEEAVIAVLTSIRRRSKNGQVRNISIDGRLNALWGFIVSRWPSVSRLLRRWLAMRL